MTMNERDALQYLESGLQHMWKGEIDAALELYDKASAAAESDDTREVITIRKAEALIASERDGAEVSALPGIVMRRRSHRHVYMAAAVLMRRFVEADDRKRAIFYGEIARTAVAELNDPFARATVLNHLGITLVADSQFAPAVEALEEAMLSMSLLDESRDDYRSLRSSILGNLGGAKILGGETRAGIKVLEGVFHQLDDNYLVAEACLDLCFAYMELERYDIAEMYGDRALHLASVRRQIRNGNHLLGEICLRTQRYDEADQHFDVVASYYPEFKNVKQLLTAVDLCAVVNWKA
jgi:tetratricopeptide (TPR) repeat protein